MKPYECQYIIDRAGGRGAIPGVPVTLIQPRSFTRVREINRQAGSNPQTLGIDTTDRIVRSNDAATFGHRVTRESGDRMLQHREPFGIMNPVVIFVAADVQSQFRAIRLGVFKLLLFHEVSQEKNSHEGK